MRIIRRQLCSGSGSRQTISSRGSAASFRALSGIAKKIAPPLARSQPVLKEGIRVVEVIKALSDLARLRDALLPVHITNASSPNA
jgi:hypothetical protein